MIEKKTCFLGLIFGGKLCFFPCRFFFLEEASRIQYGRAEFIVSSGWFNHYIAKMTVDDVFLLQYLQKYWVVGSVDSSMVLITADERILLSAKAV